MKRCVLLLVLGLVTIVVWPATASASQGSRPAAPMAGWTVALYIDADNNLEDAWKFFDAPELARLQADTGVNIVAVVDGRGRHGTKLVEFGDGSARTVATYPEKNFGSGATFTWFLRRVAALYPSGHLLVDVWDHGSAWQGFAWDDTSRDHISMPELRAALVDAGVDIDILACDTCLSSDIEVAYDVALTHRVRYLVASEDYVPLDGFAYDAMLAPLAADPLRSPETVLTDLLTGWQRYYRTLRFDTQTTLSAVDVTRVLAMRGDLRRWSDLLRADIPTSGKRYAADLKTCIYPSWYCWQVDLRSIAMALASDAAITDPALRAASQTVADDVQEATLGVVSGSYSRAYTGLTLWWGTSFDWSEYRAQYAGESAFGAQVGWYDFLRAFNASPAAGQSVPDPVLDRARFGLDDVLFTDALHGCAVGYDNEREQALVLRTGNGGATWKRVPVGLSPMSFTSLAARGARRVASVGSVGGWRSTLLRSSDGGASWRATRVATPRYLCGLDFVAASRGWAVGNAGTLLRTLDGGKTWRRPAGSRLPLDYAAVDFTDGTQGWVVGGTLSPLRGTVCRSLDGGRTLTAETSVDGVLFTAVEALSDGNVWAVGGDPAGDHGVILHSADGVVWTAQLSGAAEPRLSDVLMLDAQHGWAVGDAGTVLRTGDGGATWTPQATGSSLDLAAVTFADAEHGWIVGDGETILATTNGGDTWAAQTPALSALKQHPAQQAVKSR